MGDIQAKPSACARLFCEQSPPLKVEHMQFLSPVKLVRSTEADDIIPFAFDTPSPDDLVKAAKTASTCTNTKVKPKGLHLPVKRRAPYIRKNGTVA